MSTSERDVESYLVKRVRQLGGKSIKLAPTETGIPDRLVMWPNGRMELVEVKAAGGRLSRGQQRWHAKVAEHQNIHVFVTVGRVGVDRYIEEENDGYQGS